MELPFWTARVETLRLCAVVCVKADRRDVRRRMREVILGGDCGSIELWKVETYRKPDIDIEEVL